MGTTNICNCFGRYSNSTYASCMSCPIETVRRCKRYTYHVDELDAIKAKADKDIKRLADAGYDVVKKIKRAFMSC